MPTDGWIDKEYVVYIYNGILFSHKKGWHFAICDNMDGPWGLMLREIKSDTEKQIPYNLIYMWNLNHPPKKNPPNLEQIGGCQRQMVGDGWNGWRWSKGTNF